MLKKIAKFIAWVFVVIVGGSFLFVLFTAKGKHDTSKPRAIQIADKTFVLPAGFEYRRYGKTQGGYDQLELTLDVNTFKLAKQDFSSGNTTISVELRPLRSEWAEKKHWTKDDPVYQSKQIGCAEVVHMGRKYESCEQSDKPTLVSGTRVNVRSIKDKEKNQYIAIYGCSGTKSREICISRSRIMDNLQVEYSYGVEHFGRSVEIDFAIRDLIESMHQPSPKGVTP
jgi:hypothetical protein